jgi:hypothetical protein
MGQIMCSLAKEPPIALLAVVVALLALKPVSAMNMSM